MDETTQAKDDKIVVEYENAMQFEFFQYFMNSGLSRDKLLVIFVVSFSVFLFFTYLKIRLKEMSKHDADANENT